MEDLQISLPDDTELKPMGLISSIVEKLGMFMFNYIFNCLSNWMDVNISAKQ